MAKGTFLQDFKSFAMKGNVVDMAVGVIIGGAFGKIVTSVVNDIIMPPIGWLIGGVNFKDLKLELPINPISVKEGVEAVPVTINYGNFLQTTFDFLIIAFSIFLFISLIKKVTERMKNEEPAPEPAPAPAPEPSNEEKLLAEIRDLLKKENPSGMMCIQEYRTFVFGFKINKEDTSNEELSQSSGSDPGRCYSVQLRRHGQRQVRY